VLVPGFVEELDEAHAAFDQPPSEQAIIGEGRFAGFGAVHFEVAWDSFERSINSGAALHAVRHFEGIDATGDLGIADQVEMLLVQFFDGVERIALHLLIDSLGLEDRVPDRRNCETGLPGNGKEETATPIRCAAAVPLAPELKTT